MSSNAKTKYIVIILRILLIFLVIKAVWFVAEMVWFPAEGVTHVEDHHAKPLYYKVKLTENKKAVPPPVKKKPLASIKDIQLLAIYNDSDITVVTVKYKGKTKVLGRGDTINGFRLEGAGNDFATFRKNNKRYQVDLQKSKRQGAGSIQDVPSKEALPKKMTPSVKAEEPDGEIVDAGDHKIVDRSLFDHYVKNMNDIYKNIGIKEVKKGNGIDGFKITFVRRGSPFAKLGIKRGDILKSVNGQELKSYSDAFEAYKRMNDVQNVTIVIERGKKTMELEYEIN